MFSSSVGTRGDSIALDLVVENDRTLLEFAAAEDRVFSVGSSPHADVRVRRPGVPPIAFYLERRGDAVWLVPGYRRSSLRVDAAFVIAPCRLGRCARIEFSRVRARVALHTGNDAADSADAEVDDAPTELNESTRRFRLEYLASLPDVQDRTEVSASQPALEVAVPSPPHDSSSRDSSRDSGRDSEGSSLPSRSRSGPRLTQREESPALPAALPAKRPKLAKLPRPAKPVKPPPPPPLWVCLEQRPFEAALLIVLIGLVILAAAVAAACFVR
jgi:hypothetical protein